MKVSKLFRTMILGIFCTLVATVGGFRAYSQAATADIVGTVRDPAGALVIGATVTARNLETNQARTTTSSSAGEYSFSLLTIGTYSVNIEAQGFKTFSVTSVHLSVGDRTRVDAQLQIGSTSETVEVNEQIPALQTDSSSVGSLVSQKSVQDLPVNGRNFMSLVQISPGATEGPSLSMSSGARPDDRRQTSAVSVNGQTDTANNYLLDGMDNNERNIATVVVKPSIDAQQEVRVYTNLPSAEFGRAGGAVVNIITKSGSNNFHGTVFEYLRNDIFDANSHFNSSRKPEYRQNQFGGSFGGPIVKNRTFFFLDYEGFRKVQGQLLSQQMPSACQLGRAACNGIQQVGNFSDLTSVKIYDPNTSAALVNNVIPSGELNSISKNWASLLPNPTSCTSAAVCFYQSTPKLTQYAHTADIRIDHNRPDKDSLYARYSINNTNTHTPTALPPTTFNGTTIYPGGPNGSWFGSSALQQQQSLTIGETHVFRPNLLLQISAMANRYAGGSDSLNAGVPVDNILGGPMGINTPAYPGTIGMSLFTFSSDGYSQIGDTNFLPTKYYDNTFQLMGALTWTKGSHAFKFGSSVIRRYWSVNQIGTKGQHAFSNAQTNSAFGAAGGAGGNSFASMLLGFPTAITQNFQLITPNYVNTEFGNFAQDDWRVARQLTLNLGLRWDIFTPFHEKHNYISNFDPTNPVVLASGHVQVAGQNGVSPTLNYTTQWGDFQPRIGFAYSLPHGTVIRGGFGTSYYPQTQASGATLKNQPVQYSLTENQVTGTGFTTKPGSVSVSTPLPTPALLSTCLAASCGNTAGLLPPAGNTTVPASIVTNANFRYALTYQYNLFVEQQVGAYIFSVGFVGVNGRNLGRSIGNRNLGAPQPATVTNCVRLPNPCQPYYSQLPNITSITLLTSTGISNYTAMQTQLQRRYSKGFTMAANYTWSHALADSNATSGCNGGCGQNYNDQSYDYGNSDLYIKNRFTFTGSYELPFGKNRKDLTGLFIGNWQVNGIYLWSNGAPFTVTDASGLSLLNNGLATGYRPNMAVPRVINQSTAQWFDTSAFQAQVVGLWGNEHRNQLLSPRYSKVDFSLFKTFQLNETKSLQFRVESFNLFNMASYATPGASISGWQTPSGATCTSAFVNAGTVCTPTQAGGFGQILPSSGTLANGMNLSYTPRDIQLALKFLF